MSILALRLGILENDTSYLIIVFERISAYKYFDLISAAFFVTFVSYSPKNFLRSPKFNCWSIVGIQ